MNFGTTQHATAVTSLAPSRAMPRFSYSRPTMKPVMFWRKTSGMPRWLHSSMKCAPLSADSLNRMPLLATIPTSWPQIRAKPQTSVSPYSFLNSWSRLPSTIRRITSRTSYGVRVSAGTTSYRVLGSSCGSSGSVNAPIRSKSAAKPGPGLQFVPNRRGTTGSVSTIERTIASAWASSSARWSTTPEVRACTSPPPSSSAVTTSPVAAFTSGGPPRKIVPWSLTMTDSSDIAGT